ncbi:hypothetical protein ACKWTF_004532 [Chironomus riparius]
MSSQENQLTEFLNSDSLNDDFFSDIVANKLNIPRNDFKVKLVFITPATGKNDNYASLVLRSKIRIQYLQIDKTELIDVIIKASQTNYEEISEFTVFEREKFMYENPIKTFEALWLEKAGEEINFGPKTYKFTKSPYEIIVMDDLMAKKYEMLDRKEGLSLEQSKIFLKKLAKFHAAGAVCFQKDGTLDDCLDRNCLSAPKPDINNPFTAVFIRIFEEYMKVLRTYGDCDFYADKISKWDKFFVATCYYYESKPMKCGLQVLNHGDVWTNNIMFRFDPLEVLLIDYQLCFWGSPTYDIWLFLILSVQDQIKAEKFDELIEFYYHELCESLKKLDYDHHIPSLDEFNEDIMDKAHIGTSFVPMLFFAKYSSTVDWDMEILIRETDETVLSKIYGAIFNDPVFIKATKSWLPFLEQRGFLDSLILK